MKVPQSARICNSRALRGRMQDSFERLGDNENVPGEIRKFDVIVLGAGAAGLMCAAVAGQRGRRVLLLEHNTQPGRKILISGGGRCNFTNIHCSPANFISENPHFAKSALALYEPRHFLELVERYGIEWHEKTLGQLFCDHAARQIVDMLLQECARGQVEILLNARGIAVEGASVRFRLSAPRAVHGGGIGGCYGRAVDSEDGRDWPGVRAGAAIRAEGG